MVVGWRTEFGVFLSSIKVRTRDGRERLERLNERLTNQVPHRLSQVPIRQNTSPLAKTVRIITVSYPQDSNGSWKVVVGWRTQ